MTKNGPSPKNRRNLATNTPWEPLVGYSRAVRVGDRIFVSGTTATREDGSIAADGDAAGQTRQAPLNVERALVQMGASLADVVRTHIYVVDIDDWEAVGRVHGAIFADIRPATALVEVRRLVPHEALVEIEADAIV